MRLTITQLETLVRELRETAEGLEAVVAAIDAVATTELDYPPHSLTAQLAILLVDDVDR